MTSPPQVALAPNLRVLDEVTAPKGLDLASELFHRINRIIPQEQRVLSVPPTCKARDAIALMKQHGYSQVPVVLADEVLGVFSYRSFAGAAAAVSPEDVGRHKAAPGDSQVDEFLEQFAYARVTEEMRNVFDSMDRDNGLLVGAPDRLIGILTPMDFLRYLYEVASPFVLISEIELALRALIRTALTDEQLAEGARRSLASAYQGRPVPTVLEEMTFDNYRAILSHGGTWSLVEATFGCPRAKLTARLKQAGDLRNDIFHFRRQPTIQDHQDLTDHRNWLLAKLKQARPRSREEGPR